MPIAPLILLFRPDFFRSDRELIERIRRAQTANQVWQEVREFFSNPDHEAHWWHRKANVRVSGERLMYLARQYLPSSGHHTTPHHDGVGLERHAA